MLILSLAETVIHSDGSRAASRRMGLWESDVVCELAIWSGCDVDADADAEVDPDARAFYALRRRARCLDLPIVYIYLTTIRVCMQQTWCQLQTKNVLK